MLGRPGRPPAGISTLFAARGNICPSVVKPCRYSKPEPSSHSTIPPRGLTQMLPGFFSTAALGGAKGPRSAPLDGSYSKTWPCPVGPPLVETMYTLPSAYHAPSSRANIAAPCRKPCVDTRDGGVGSGSAMGTHLVAA